MCWAPGKRSRENEATMPRHANAPPVAVPPKATGKIKPKGRDPLLTAAMLADREAEDQKRFAINGEEIPSVLYTETGTALWATEVPEVYRNLRGVQVDRRGIALSLTQLRQHHHAAMAEVLGKPADTPAEVMRGIALDPRYDIKVRLDAAKAAAPYYDRKMPVSIEQKDTTPGAGSTIDMAALAALPKGEREALLATLGKLGVRI